MKHPDWKGQASTAEGPARGRSTATRLLADALRAACSMYTLQISPVTPVEIW